LKVDLSGIHCPTLNCHLSWHSKAKAHRTDGRQMANNNDASASFRDSSGCQINRAQVIINISQFVPPLFIPMFTLQFVYLFRYFIPEQSVNFSEVPINRFSMSGAHAH